MLIKFLKHTGAARDGQPGDPDARLAIDYLQGEMVLKPERAGGPKVWTRRATAPIPISGHAWLISQTCAALPFQHRYTSGVIAFDRHDIDIAAWTRGDLALRGLTDALMRDFEDTAFAGIPEEHRPEVLWNAHTDKRRLELNFLFARAVLDSQGRLKAINPRPPEKVGIALWEAFRDSWNHRHGWADPLAPERHRHLKLPGSVISSPARDIEGNPIFDIREELDMAVGMEIERGRIASRNDVLAWLEAQGHRIKRKGKNYISVECLLPPERGGLRNAPNRYAKAIRLCGDLFDQRFTSPAWLDECGWNDGGLPPQRRDMRGAAATLDRLRALRAAHHRERLGWPEEAPDPEPDAEDEIEGTTCAWSPPLPTLGRQPDTRTKPRRPSFDEARLPEDLIAKLRFVDYRKRRIWLQDGSSVEDQEIRLKAHSRSHDTIRLMIAQAQLKRWSGISVRGDAAFLRNATRLAFAAGIEIAGRSEDMDRIVQAELKLLRAKQDAAKDADADMVPDARDGAEPPVPDEGASKVDADQPLPWFEDETDWDDFRAKLALKAKPRRIPEAEAEAEAEEFLYTLRFDVNADDDALQDDTPDEGMSDP